MLFRQSFDALHSLTTIIAGFLYFWGIVFFVTTTLVWLMKRERDDTEDEQGIVDTYKQLWRVVKLPSVISYAIILLTSKVCTEHLCFQEILG